MLPKSQTITGFGAGQDEPYFVSSDTSSWSRGNDIYNYHSSISVAVAFDFTVDVRVSDEQDGESFTRRFACGPNTSNQPNVNLLDLVPDDGADGWITVELQGMERSWFSDGTVCRLTWLHEAYVHNDPGDGEDDVVFGTPDRLGISVYAWIYDPDNVPSGNASSATTQSRAGPLEVGECRKTDSGEVCKDVAPRWYQRK